MRNFIDIVEAKTLPLRPGVIKQARGAYGAFICVMRPEDFLELTTYDQKELQQIKDKRYPIPDDEYVERMGADMAASYPPGRFDMPFLYVGFPSGKVEGHEGRHRAAMVLRDGGRSFPVMIYPRADTVYVVKSEYRDQDDESHFEEVEFTNRRKADSHEMGILMKSLRDQDPVDRRHHKTTITTHRGDKLRGAPERSLKPYQYAAWRVEDFPKQLVAQYNDWMKVTRFKVGLVKGYRHHQEPDAN